MKRIEINYEMIGQFNFELYKYLPEDLNTNYCSISSGLKVGREELRPYYEILNKSLLELIPGLESLKTKISSTDVTLIFNTEKSEELSLYDIKKINYSLFKWIQLVYLLIHYFFEDSGEIKIINSQYIPKSFKENLINHFKNIKFIFVDNELLEI